MCNESTEHLLDRLTRQMEKLGLTNHQKSQLCKVLETDFFYVHDPIYDDEKSTKPILEKKIDVLPGMSLTSDMTDLLFLQMNYYRYHLHIQQQRILKYKRLGKVNARRLLDLYHHQLCIREKIVTGNMGLVLAMAKQVNYYGVEFTELVSEGSMALLRATERFDSSRGFKFSTYACRAILKGFSRAAKRNYRYRNLFPTQLDTTLEKDDHIEHDREVIYQETVQEIQTMFQDNLAELSNTEQTVVQMRFSLNKKKNDPMTLKQVGEILGLSKERIRQIQNKALAKLRVAAEEHLLSV